MLVTSQGADMREGAARLVLGERPPEDGEGGRRRFSRHLHVLLVQLQQQQFVFMDLISCTLESFEKEKIVVGRQKD